MFVTTPEIVWHNKEPIFSIDFHHNTSDTRIATAGADQTIKLWKMVKAGEKMKVVFLASLERHSKSINTVRFSPKGSMLASAGDDGVVFLWKQSNNSNGNGEDVARGNLDETDSKETWVVTTTLRGHIEDIYDSCWSSDGRYLMTGSVDSSVIVWNATNGDKVAMLKESHHYIQGVAWSPLGYLATLGTDRFLRVYNNKFKCIHSLSKWTNKNDKQERLFHDESMGSFFRRLSFSPDGLLLVVPSGKLETTSDANVTWIFTISSLPKPVLYLPASDKPTLVVKFSPILYDLKPDTPSLFDLPYRMIYAVATIDTIVLYDTQQATPIGLITDIHYTSLTDLAWSDDGLLLMASSTDGYCTIIEMSPQEMGSVYRSTSPAKMTTPTEPSSPCDNSLLSLPTIGSDSSRSSSTRRIKPTPVSPLIKTATTVPQHTKPGAGPRRVNFITLSNNDS